MIELALDEILLVAVVVPILLVSFAGLIDLMRKKRHRAQLARSVVRCCACGHVFKDRQEMHYPNCERCGKPLMRGESKRLG